MTHSFEDRAALLDVELVAYARTRKKMILVPLIVIMVLLGLVIVFAQGSALAPFIYTIFKRRQEPNAK